MTSLELFFLGDYAVRLEGKPVGGFESDKVRLLLAYLAIESGRSHRRETLVGLFWPDSSEEHARQSLSQVVYNLRGILGNEFSERYLEINRKEISLQVKDKIVMDVSRFMNLIREVEQHAHSTAWSCQLCQQRLTQAANLYREKIIADYDRLDQVAAGQIFSFGQSHSRRW